MKPREREVLKLLSIGFTSRQISEELNLTVRAVNIIISRINSSLGLQSKYNPGRFIVRNQRKYSKK